MSRAIGAVGEERACAYLRANGYAILARNFTVRGGEIDIVARVGEQLVFVEVKTRANARYGLGREAVTPRKRQRIIHTALWYLAQNGWADCAARFDVIEVLPGGVVHLENAFDVSQP